MESEENNESDDSSRPRRTDHAPSLLLTEASQSQSVSPPPGPSGLPFLSPPLSITSNQSNALNVGGPLTSSHITSDGARLRMTLASVLVTGRGSMASASVANGNTAATVNTAGIEGSLNQQSVGSGVSPSSAGGHGGEEPRPHSNIFQIPPSQDILAGPNHLSLGLGGSQSIDASVGSLPPGPPPSYDFTTPDIREFIRRDDERRREEQERQREEERAGLQMLQQVLAGEERGSTLQFGGRSYPLRNNNEPGEATQSDGSQDQPAPPPYSDELIERANRCIQRQRDRLKGTPVVPGTDSRSSDEGRAASLRAAILRREVRMTSGVPQSALSMSTRVSQGLDDQVVVATASESSADGQRVPVKKVTRVTGVCERQSPPVMNEESSETEEVSQTDKADETTLYDSTTDDEIIRDPPPPTITAGPPSWGAETDASSEYAGTQTTSSSSDKATPSLGSSYNASASDSQTLPNTLPLVRSTLSEENVTALPGLPRLTLARKQMSNETSTSTNTTNSSSGGELEKIRGVFRKVGHSKPTQESSLGSLEIPLAVQTPSADMGELEVSQNEHQGVPSSLPSETETQLLDVNSQDLFHNNVHYPCVIHDSQDLANEKPSWYASIEETQVLDTADGLQDSTSQSANCTIDFEVQTNADSSSLNGTHKSQNRLPAQRKETSHFKNPNDSLISSPNSKDGSFSCSQGMSGTNSSSSSGAPKSSSSSSVPSSSSSSNYPGSITSSSGSSNSSNQPSSSSSGPDSSSSGNQPASSITSSGSIGDGSCQINASQESKMNSSGSQLQNLEPLFEESLTDTNTSIEYPIVSSKPIEDSEMEVSDSSIQEDDNTLTLEMQSPVLIDLTCQSQSVSEEPAHIQDGKTVSTLEKDIDDHHFKGEELMDVDAPMQSSFCLQLSPSQHHPITAQDDVHPMSADRESSSSSIRESGGNLVGNKTDSCVVPEEPVCSNNIQTDKLNMAHDSNISNGKPTAEATTGVNNVQAPLYESLILDNSTESLIDSEKSEVVKSNLSSDLEPDCDIPQKSPVSTGTSFRLNLLSGSLLEPLTTITPLSGSAQTQQQSAVSNPSISPTNSSAISPSKTANQSIVTVTTVLPSSTQPVHSSTADTGSNRHSNTNTCNSSDLQLEATTFDSSKENATSFLVESNKGSTSSLNDSMRDPTPILIEQQQSQDQSSPSKENSSKTQMDPQDRSSVNSTPKTPRKSLSLRSRRTPKRNLATKTLSKKSSPAFELGVSADAGEQSEMDSQMPEITLPRDSQFESSESSDLPFSIALPQETTSNDSPIVNSRPAPLENVSLSLFAGFKSSITTRTMGSISSKNNTDFEDVFNRTALICNRASQSQDSEVQFVQPGKQRNKPLSLTDSVNASTPEERANREDLNESSNPSKHSEKGHSISEPPLSAIQDTLQFEDNMSGAQAQITVATTISQPNSTGQSINTMVNSQISTSEAPSQNLNISKTAHNNITATTTSYNPINQNISTANSQSAATSQSIITPVNSQTLPLVTTSHSHPQDLSTSQPHLPAVLSTHPSFQSPLPSPCVQFTSPSTMMSPSGLEELKRQVGREGVNRYELRHVKTIRTIIEHRIVSSEVIENDQLVEGSSCVWPESFEPRVVQEVKVEIAPKHSFTSSFSFSASPQIIPTTVIQNVGPSMNIINSPTTMIESPIPLNPRGHEDRRSNRETTPSMSHRSSRPPVRRVHPLPSDDGNSSVNNSSNGSTEQDSCSSKEDESSLPPAKKFKRISTEKTKRLGAPSHKTQPASSRNRTRPTTSPSSPERVTDSHTSGLYADPRAEAVSIEVGSKVIARWKDKCWYMATIIAKGKQGRVRVQYADGDTGSVTSNNLILTDCLKEGVLVSAVPLPSTLSQSADTLQPDSVITGVFEGFVDEAQEMFKFRSGSELLTFSSACLCVSSESIKSCVEDDKTSPKIGGMDRKRKRRSIPQHKELPAAPVRKKKRISSPAVPSQGNLFRGYSFMLTQRPKDEAQTASPNTSTVNRDSIAQQIRSRGGRIMDTFNRQQIVDGQSFVLSDNFCKTKKYLLGLAMNISCISYSWISKCIEQGFLVDTTEFRLPVGANSIDGSIIPWSPKNRSNLFRECTFHMLGEVGFKNHWGSVAEACGARILLKLPTMTARSYANLGSVLVICEHPDLITPSLQYQAQNAMNYLCVLSQHWIEQSLIRGQLLPYDSFRLNKY